MKVAIAFDDVEARDATPDERGVLDSVRAVEGALARLGHQPQRVPVSGDIFAWLTALHGALPAVVFNLCEGIAGRSELEPHFAAVVELLGIAITGSGAATLALARRKDRVNAILDAASQPVPAWTLVPNGHAPGGWTHYPAIVKPAAEDGSVGMDAGSVARSLPELERAIARARRWAPLLVQSYVHGRELNVAFVGREPLPISEIVFTVAAGAWPIVDYRAKWVSGSDEEHATPVRCPAPLDGRDATRVLAAARAAWQAVGGRGYGRVDLRLDPDGGVHILEVNPNPDLAPDAGLARAAGIAGWNHDELIARILTEAVR